MEKEEHLQKIEACSKDKSSFEELKRLWGELSDERDRYREYLSLLERSIRNDYDSILITEIELEPPGPRIVYVNDGFTRITGYSREEVIGKTPRILQGPKTERSVLDRLKKRLQNGQPFFGHAVNYRKDGTEFVNQWDIHPLVDEAGNLTHWVSYQHDVSERKRSEKALVDTQLEFDSLHEEAKSIRADLDMEGRILVANKAFREVCGYRPEDLEGKRLADFLVEGSSERLAQLIGVADEGSADSKELELTIRTGPGVNLDVNVRSRVLSSDGKRIIRLKFENRSLQKRIAGLLRTRTLSDRRMEKKTDFEYRASEKDGELICTWISQSFRNITGIETEECVGHPMKSLIAEGDWPVVERHLRSVLAGSQNTEVYHIQTQGGKQVPVVDAAKPHPGTNGADLTVRGSVSVAPSRLGEQVPGRR